MLDLRRIAAVAWAVAALGAVDTQALGAVQPGPAPAPAAPLFTITDLHNGVFAAISPLSSRAGSNAGFVISDDGVLVVDAFFTPEAARALLAEIRKRTPLPIRYLVNTHHHIDHTGGDAVFREAGAVIIAHDNVRGWIHSENVRLFGDRITPALKAQAEALAEPDLTVSDRLTIWLGRRKVEVRHVLGHTGGDLIVRVADAKVLFAGDMLWRRVCPNLIDGDVAEWITADQALQKLPDAALTRFVPGHGDLADLTDITDFWSYLHALRANVQYAANRGLTGEAMVAEIVPKLRSGFGDWAGFEQSAPREIRYMEAELKGVKRRPTPADD